ncbi:MAG: hypothetical protein KGL39_59835 [Patescibacteria group bacterium]|nr:hypothetical protein [Patescibacteria group bacterium]
MELSGTVQQHTSQIEKLDGRLDKLEARMDQLLPWQERVDLDLYNHGREGIKTVLTTFVAEHRSAKEEREAQEKRNAQRTNMLLTIAGIVATLLLVAVGWLAYLQTLHAAKNGLLNMPAISHSEQGVDVYARNRTDAGNFPRNP